MTVRLDWRGDQVLAHVARAAKHAIDETTDEAARDARGSHWWKRQTGRLEANLINEPARKRGLRVSGRFGSTQRQGFVGLFHERRTPFLRPAADRTFGKLAGRIRARVR